MFVRWILLILGIITLVDIVLVIVEPTSPTETTTEIIMLIVSVAALVTAIISQVDASREEKRLYKIIDGLKEINDKDEKELDHQTTMTRKINELLEADQRIEKELKHRSRKRHFKIKKAAKILLGFVTLGSLLSALPASALTEDQKSAISANCSTIKQQLKQVQKVDSRTRSYLGTSYEKVISNFVTPLNLRLVKNNRANTSLSDIQTKLVNERKKFSETFVSYSQDLEELINVDCENEPDNFYTKLNSVREKRKNVQSVAGNIRQLIKTHISTVREMEKSL